VAITQLTFGRCKLEAQMSLLHSSCAARNATTLLGNTAKTALSLHILQFRKLLQGLWKTNERKLNNHLFSGFSTLIEEVMKGNLLETAKHIDFN